jgi:hypothetical protein
MADAVFIVVIFGFFALCVLYVLGCERIIRGAEQDANTGEVAEHDRVAPERVVR